MYTVPCAERYCTITESVSIMCYVCCSWIVSRSPQRLAQCVTSSGQTHWKILVQRRPVKKTSVTIQSEDAPTITGTPPVCRVVDMVHPCTVYVGLWIWYTPVQCM